MYAPLPCRLIWLILYQGICEIYLRPHPSELSTSPIEHSHTLDYLDWLHPGPFIYFLHLCRGDPYLQLPQRSHRFHLLRTSWDDASRLVLALRP